LKRQHCKSPIQKKEISGYKIYQFDVIRHYGIFILQPEKNDGSRSTLIVVDLNSDDNKVLASYKNAFYYVTSVAHDGQYVYITDMFNGIHVLNIPIPYMEPIVNYLLF
jgi:hypothetical protein